MAPPVARLPFVWATTSDEVADDFPCAGLVPEPMRSLYRAITIDATPRTVFGWLCQLKIAPYSYDLIDNLGRRSPRELTPGAEDLALGQQWVGVFHIVDFAVDEQITGTARPKAEQLFGPMACTYRVRALTTTSSRLVVRLDVGAGNRITGPALAWGDLVMMRKQLRTIKQLAELGRP
jgi:hypothetical protein